LDDVLTFKPSFWVVSSSLTAEVVRLTASSPPGRLVIKQEKRDETAESREPDTAIPSSRLRRELSRAVAKANDE
jgi:hypothetical protein